jgi:hypothetical protein
VNGYSVDLVPGKRQDSFGDDHSLYRRRADTWTKTNVVKHITHVISARRQQESRLLKIWRTTRNLDFPSFYLELTVIEALSGRYGSLSDNVWRVFHYLQDTFPNTRVTDPANTNNIISDDLSVSEKARVKAAAGQLIKTADWKYLTT